MARINVPPTRSNLLRTRQELHFAREGYEILDRKRDVLATELVRLAHDAEALQEKVEKMLADAYRALEKAMLTMGREHVEWAALAVHKTVDVQLKYRGVMGVSLPVIEASGEPPEMTYSLGDTAAALDEASAVFREVLELHSRAVPAGDLGLAPGGRAAQDAAPGQCAPVYLYPPVRGNRYLHPELPRRARA